MRGMSEEQTLQSETCRIVATLEVLGQCWERISMDFITHLPRTRVGYDSLMVIIDYMTKMVILRPTHSTAAVVDIAKIFMDTVV